MITIGIGGIVLLLYPIAPFVAAMLLESPKKERLQIWLFGISTVLALAFSYMYSISLVFAEERSSGILDDLFITFYSSFTYPLSYYCVIVGLLVLGLRAKRNRNGL
ncbi:MAG: hypothetical protein IPK58_25035 [Acidobacteria bacterium]|nr:hypothetical protein [Acidobacteriota bacterium]